jgi:hypothetical protein
MAGPNSPEEWMALAKRYEATARLAAEHRVAAPETAMQVGWAVEAALKAYIMKKEKLNNWPGPDFRPDLWVHDIQKLREIAGIKVNASDPMAPAWHVVQQWNRAQGYSRARMSRKAARGWVEAAFGPLGVVTWLRQNL